jgi:hypothetical protein
VIARETAFGETANIVGLLVCGISPSGYADVVAFHHPHGDGELLPIHEHTDPATDVYAWGTLRPEGLTMFYPEGTRTR